MINLVHGVDTIALNSAVVDLGIAVNMRRRRKAPIRHHVFRNKSEDVVLLQGEDVFTDDKAVMLPLG